MGEELESIMAFVEEACSAVADYIGDEDVTSSRLACGKVLKPYVLKIVPELISATFELIAQVPWAHIKESVPRTLRSVQEAFPDKYSAWLIAALSALPPAVAKSAQEQHFVTKLATGDDDVADGILQSISVQC